MGRDRCGVRLHLAEDSLERADEFGLTGKEAIVRSVFSRVLPEPLRRIELRRVRRQVMNVQPMPIGLEPTPHVGVLVVGSVVLDQNRAPAAIDNTSEVASAEDLSRLASASNPTCDAATLAEAEGLNIRVCRLCGQAEQECHKCILEPDAEMRSKANTEGSLRNLPALIRRPNGIEGVSRPNVHFAFADCRSCVDVRVEIIDRQNFPIAGST